MEKIKELALRYVDNSFYLNDECILNCNDRVNNYSRICGHRLGEQTHITISNLININKDNHMMMHFENAPDAILFTVVDILLSDYFMHHTYPLKVAEFGCENGVLSYHIAPLLAAYDPEAQYANICSGVENDNHNRWLSIISQTTRPSNTALIASGYKNTMLESKLFDVTVINGTVHYDDPMKTVKEASRITKDTGIIICFSDYQYLLEDSFKLAFDSFKEWRFSSRYTIIRAENTN